MLEERVVVFEHRGLAPQFLTVEWPQDLPLPKEPNLPRGSRAIEMPNGVHKGIALGPINEIYHCVSEPAGYKWSLAEDFR